MDGRRARRVRVEPDRRRRIAHHKHESQGRLQDGSSGRAEPVCEEIGKKEDAPTVLTATLSSGNTSLTFSNAAITTTAMYDVYADKYGLTPTDITITTGQAVLTFASQSTNVSVKLVIR